MKCGNCVHLEGWGDDEKCSLERCIHAKDLPWLFEHNLPLLKHDLPRSFYMQHYSLKDPTMQKFIILLKCHTSCLCRVTEHPSRVRIELYDPVLGRIKGKAVKEVPPGTVSLEELYENYRGMKYYHPGSGAGMAAGFAKEKAAKKVKRNILKARVKK